MIRYKDKTFEQWSICPATGDIFDSKSGKVQDIILDLRGYANFKGMPVHRIMAYTFYGYKPGLVVHHLNQKKTDNALANLVYLTPSEHRKIHNENMSEETHAKLSAIWKGKHLPKETKAKIAASHKGMTLSEETKAKLSAVMKGRTSPMKGRHLSEETKMKLSLSLKGKPKTDKTNYKGHIPWNKDKKVGVRSEETRRKISEALKGKPRSEEIRLKISTTMKGKKQSRE